MTITAKITATPSANIDRDNSCHSGSVDAEIYADGEYLCDVTLCERMDGRPGLETWGADPHAWCSDPSALGDDVAAMAGEIVHAVLFRLMVRHMGSHFRQGQEPKLVH